jgi:oxygen-independent coproporphyrinogen-3 oxidase
MSVYMLEVDDESRLGREVLAAGERYGADAVASEDESAERYERGCETLKAAGLEQYEISNFARAGFASRHNVKYWRRQPYLGFGLDAHSMLPTGLGTRAVRWANTSDMDRYLAAGGPFPMHIDAAREVNAIAPAQVFEEAMFLGLRMNEGVSPDALRAEFGNAPVDAAMLSMQDVLQAGLLQCEDGRLRLTARGRMASNEVFSRLLIADAPTVVPHEFVECISA